MELLVIRALSLNLVKGVIDEVDEKVHMTWVQPRVLNNEQVMILKPSSTYNLKDWPHARSSGLLGKGGDRNGVID